MKKNIILIALLSLGISGQALAQDRAAIKPYYIYDNPEDDVKITLGARFITDLAYNSSDFTPVRSGADISDARVRTSLTYKNWYFYGDFDFGGGKFHQRNLFVRYYLKNDEQSSKSIKFGYYAEPFSMNLNTSEYAMKFINRPTTVNALGNFRALGVTYKYYNNHFFSDQGIFTEDVLENKKPAGNQSWNLTGRYVYIPVNKPELTAHIGTSLRYRQINGGELINEGRTLKTNLNVSSALEMGDHNKEFLNANVPWAKNLYKIGFEGLVKTPRFFARGEYMMQKITKQRPDQELFDAQLGGVWSWTTLKSWQKANPLGDSNFDGGYLELGYLLNNKSNYKYNKEFALISGNYEPGALELVARYSYTNLNDIKDGDVFLKGKNKFYPDGNITDYPNESLSIAGGKAHAATVGLNYTINRHAIISAGYTYTNLDNPYYPDDKNFHSVQARMMFSF
ncbi:porin [Riemerella columbina]|uniref:porin n=1 Tax=Riemerella columbina TaxID=103810 RepID=UPI00266FBAA8|nr:porin [Riemerella columbina]WKS94971.1 porin [Riemerella columbina]